MANSSSEPVKPPTDSDEPATIVVYCTKGERRALKSALARLGMNMSGWFREKLNELLANLKGD